MLASVVNEKESAKAANTVADQENLINACFLIEPSSGIYVLLQSFGRRHSGFVGTIKKDAMGFHGFELRSIITRM